jgi:hypothetical protein
LYQTSGSRGLVMEQKILVEKLFSVEGQYVTKSMIEE